MKFIAVPKDVSVVMKALMIGATILIVGCYTFIETALIVLLYAGFYVL